MKKNDTEFDEFAEDYNKHLVAWPDYFKNQDLLFKTINNLGAYVVNEGHILEVGCGTGITTARLAFLSQQLPVIAIDNSQSMINEAKKIINRLTDRVEFHCADLFDYLPKHPGEYPVVCSSNTIHNLPDWKTALMFIYHSLMDYGLFALNDIIARDSDEEYEEDYQWTMKNMKKLKEIDETAYQKWIAHYEKDRERKIRESELIEHMRHVGFRDIETHYREHMNVVLTAKK